MADKPTITTDEVRAYLKGAESYLERDPAADFVEWRIARAYLAERARAEALAAENQALKIRIGLVSKLLTDAYYNDENDVGYDLQHVMMADRAAKMGRVVDDGVVYDAEDFSGMVTL